MTVLLTCSHMLPHFRAYTQFNTKLRKALGKGKWFGNPRVYQKVKIVQIGITELTTPGIVTTSPEEST